MSTPTGAHIVARSLRDLGVTVIFGIVGIPVVEIAEEAINLGIRFIGFRNEQAAGYAASAYGYLTGRPGVCLVVGGPGVLHAMAGVRKSTLKCTKSTEGSLDRKRKRQCVPSSRPRRLLGNPPHLPGRISRARCNFPPHPSHKAQPPPSIP